MIFRYHYSPLPFSCQCTFCAIISARNQVKCAICNVQCSMCNVQCAMCNVQWFEREGSFFYKQFFISRNSTVIHHYTQCNCTLYIVNCTLYRVVLCAREVLRAGLRLKCHPPYTLVNVMPPHCGIPTITMPCQTVPANGIISA